MSNLKGVVMVGGFGTRFKPLTDYLQKCMIPIGRNEKPILEYIVRLYKHHDIEEVVLLAGYKHQQIRNYFNDGERFGVNISYVLDRPDLKGSANALLNAYWEGVLSKDDTLVIYYGDIVSNIDLKEMYTQHLQTNADTTLGLATSFKVNVGVAGIKGQWVKTFEEKPALESPVTIGVLTMSGTLLPLIEKLHEEHDYKSFDIMGHVIQHLVETGGNVGAYLTDAFWYDVGSIERLERLDSDILSRELDFLFKPSLE